MITASSLFGYDATSFAHLDLGILCHSSQILSTSFRLHGEWTAIYFQVSPQNEFDWFQVRVLAGPLKDIHRVVPKPLLHCLCYVLRVIVLVEGEPSA